MRKFRVLAWVCLLALLTSTAHAQYTEATTGSITTSSIDCTTAAACVSLQLRSTDGSLSLKIAGTYSATLQFESSVDGTTWAGISGDPLPSGSRASSTTSTGTWVFNVAGLGHFRVRASAYTSGTASIALRPSAASASSRSVENLSLATLNGVRYADQFPGSDACAQIEAAIVDLPSTGGTVDARGFEGAQTCADDPFEAVTTEAVTLLLGATTITTDTTWVIPHLCKVIGQGRAITYIKASAGFTSSYVNSSAAARAAVVVLGNLNPASFNSRLEELSVHGNSIADYGVYSENINEQAGLINVHVYDALLFGVRIEKTTSGTPQHWTVDNLHVTVEPGNSVGGTMVGLQIDGGTVTNYGANNITIDVNLANGGAGVVNAMVLDATSGTFTGLHFEGATNGLLIGPTTATAGVTAVGVTGNTDVTTTVRIDNAASNQRINLFGIAKHGGTNTLVDEINSYTNTESHIGMYLLGEGNTANESVLSTSRVARQKIMTSNFQLSGVTGTNSSLDFYDGDTNQWHLQREANNVGFQIRDNVTGMHRFRAVTNASTEINSDNTGSILINSTANSGTGGIELYNGAASPARVLHLTSDGNVLPETTGTQTLGNSGKQWQVFHEVVATASLPAAGASSDGRVIIEDVGAGDRNLIIYAGGQRFRIDGGAAF